MKLLHTSDWHVGKALRGRSRADEHVTVLAELAAAADEHAVDAVLVGGDLFDSAAPTPESERIVWRALLALAGEGGGRPVVVIAGNHDNQQRLAAVAPVFAAHGVTIVATPSRPDDGGVLRVATTGGDLRVAALPFPSQRGIVTADTLLSGDAAQHGGDYAERVRRIVALLTDGFGVGDSVDVVLAHLMVLGGTLGGGERGAHTIFDYWVPATAFPGTAHYAALGHLHRSQQLDAPCPVHYCGSPLQLDFGETANQPVAKLVVAEPGRAGVEVRDLALVAGRRLRVLRGTFDALMAQAGDAGDEHLKLVVEGGARPGLADELRDAFPAAVDVALAAPDAPVGDDGAVPSAREGRTPHELFADYLAERDASDERVLALFDELVDEVSEAVP